MNKYRYNKAAGALNEVAVETRAPPQANAPARQQPLYSQSLAPLDDIEPEDYASAHDSSVVALPAFARGAAPIHAQTLVPSPESHRTASPARSPASPSTGRDLTRIEGSPSMFWYTVAEGQRVRMVRPDGRIEVLEGPRRVWRGRNRFEAVEHFVAHPGEFLIVRFRDGNQEHLPGPADLWHDPRIHLEVTREDALQIATKEAVVVYSQNPSTGAVTRRVEHGPATFVPKPGEWLHTFSWHGSKGGHKGYQKVPNALVFQKLWMLPDQMYHDVNDVRTADDAVLTIRLMLFFELVDVELMLSTTHDPIGDFVNAATSDVVEFTGRHDLEAFKRHTDKLNDVATYKQVTARADQCGYRINKIVYRGYGAPDSLQRMHDEAIEQRTRLQLERATQQQAQELEDFKQERQFARATRQRSEADAAASQDIDLARRQQEAELERLRATREYDRAQEAADADQRLQSLSREQAQRRAHLASLKEIGVDLTALLTQGRADQVIELRGGDNARPHVHLGVERDR